MKTCLLVPLVKDTNRSPPPPSRTCNVSEGVCVWGFGGLGGVGGIECLLDKHTEAGRDRVSPGWAHIEL